jgi:hypothetical protein
MPNETSHNHQDTSEYIIMLGICCRSIQEVEEVLSDAIIGNVNRAQYIASQNIAEFLSSKNPCFKDFLHNLRITISHVETIPEICRFKLEKLKHYLDLLERLIKVCTLDYSQDKSMDDVLQDFNKMPFII